MTGEELKKLATAAYGTRWKMIVGGQMDVSREMLWRYETSVTPISEELAGEFRKLFKMQIERQLGSLNAILQTL